MASNAEAAESRCDGRLQSPFEESRGLCRLALDGPGQKTRLQGDLFRKRLPAAADDG